MFEVARGLRTIGTFSNIVPLENKINIKHRFSQKLTIREFEMPALKKYLIKSMKSYRLNKAGERFVKCFFDLLDNGEKRKTGFYFSSF